jgi:hypothetical protein
MKEERFQLFVMAAVSILIFEVAEPKATVYQNLAVDGIGVLAFILIMVYVFDMARDLWGLRPGWLAG